MVNPAKTAERLVALIRRAPSRRFTFLRLAEKLEVSESEIAAGIDTAADWGYKFRVGSGWCQFRSAPDALIDTEISRGLKTLSFGKTIHTYRSVKSTITIASKLADDGAPEGTLVIAEKQTQGRGRLGRSWHSPEGVGAYLSLIVRPDFQPIDAPALSIVTALAYVEAIEKETGVSAQVKWPNDVTIRGRKVAGILTELTTLRNEISYVIISAGMNLNHTREHFPTELRAKASSLRIARGRKVDRIAVVQRFLEHFEKRYTQCLDRGFKSLRKKILKYSSLIGNDVTILGARGHQPIRGQVLDIDESGRLVVDTSDGPQALLSGEVTLQETYKHAK
jgi:BirA family transcriptional regulator, biotin operon repressor / biotin---[acetyl-CoA-carboxylase] ligase